jgi:hypothetical protein
MLATQYLIKNHKRCFAKWYKFADDLKVRRVDWNSIIEEQKNIRLPRTPKQLA